MAEVGELPNGGSSKPQRGVVEEVISKRLKALTKKIVRIRGYGDQAEGTLNADQRSAMASLPALEAVAKELEDLIKPGGPVETAELSQAGLLRETREAAAAEAVSIAQMQLASFSDTLSKRLSQLLRLYSYLLPVNEGGHRAAADVGVDAPRVVRKRLTHADIPRIAEMHDSLLQGGEASQGVLQLLAGPADGFAGSDAHLLELMTSLDEDKPESGMSEPSTLVQPQFGSVDSEDLNGPREPHSRLPTDSTIQTKVSDDGIPLGASSSSWKEHQTIDAPHDETFETCPSRLPPPPEPEPSAAKPAGPPTLNFLQVDELADEAVVAEAPAEVAQPTAVEGPVTTQPVQEELTAVPPPITSTSSKVDWTADDADDDVPIFGSGSASASAAPAEVINPPEIASAKKSRAKAPRKQNGVGASLASPIDFTANVKNGDSSSSSAGAKSARGPRRGKAQKSTQPGGSERPEINAPSQAALHMLDLRKGVLVDNEGFEQLVKKQASPQGQPGQPGRGGGRGRGSRNGQGQGGRGERGRGLPAKPSQSGEAATNGQSRSKPQQQRQPPKATSKPALYKADVVAQ